MFTSKLTDEIESSTEVDEGWQLPDSIKQNIAKMTEVVVESKRRFTTTTIALVFSFSRLALLLEDSAAITQLQASAIVLSMLRTSCKVETTIKQAMRCYSHSRSLLSKLVRLECSACCVSSSRVKALTLVFFVQEVIDGLQDHLHSLTVDRMEYFNTHWQLIEQWTKKHAKHTLVKWLLFWADMRKAELADIKPFLERKKDEEEEVKEHEKKKSTNRGHVRKGSARTAATEKESTPYQRSFLSKKNHKAADSNMSQFVSRSDTAKPSFLESFSTLFVVSN